MSCWRGCVHGYRGVSEIPRDEDPLSEGDILLHLERRRLLGERTRIRVCPCNGVPAPCDRGLFDTTGQVAGRAGAMSRWGDE